MKKEDEAFRQGYLAALKDCLDDIVFLHQSYKSDTHLRRALDLIWSLIKRRSDVAKGGNEKKGH